MRTQKEAAAILQVHVDTLQKFFRAYPEAREAWGGGKEIGRAKLRMLLWQQAVDNPTQARFVAKQKNWLAYQDNPIPAKAVVPVRNLPEAERLARLQELQKKVLSMTASVYPELKSANPKPRC